MQLKNKKVFFFSLIALACVVLAFSVHWAFILCAFVLMILSQKELFKNSTSRDKSKKTDKKRK